MRSRFAPLLLAAAVTICLGAAVRMTPYFPGDVAIARALQALDHQPVSWARPISNLAPAPAKYYVMAIALTAAFFMGGWRALALVAACLLIEQYGAESTKALFKRPRPSRDLITVVGSPTGYSFPSTTMTFFAATFGSLVVIAAMMKSTPQRAIVMTASALMVVLGCAARVALGAHWPSDVVITVLIVMLWIWAAARLALRTA